MANLSSSSRLGNTSTSSLIKSSRSIANAITANQDEFYRIQYQNSAKTATDLQTYQNYLTGRIGNLLSTGSVTDNTKAMTLSQNIVTATASNVSTDITRENISILNGTATPQDKLNLIQNEFNRAGSVGDTALQQSLVSQASSLSQTIQYQNQVSQTAHNTLIAAGASQQNNVAQALTDKLVQLNTDAGAAGMDKLNTVLKDYVTNNKSSFLALADNPNISQDAKAAIIAAVNNSQPNYQDILAGTTAAISSAHYLAGLMQLPVDAANGTDTASKYFQAQTDIANGTTKIPTLAGHISQQDILQWQQTPAEYIPHINADSGTLGFSYQPGGHNAGMSAINGLKFDANGNVVAAFTGQTAGTPLTQDQASSTQAQLTKLGFAFDKKATSTTASNNNGIAIQATSKLASWLKPLVGGQQNAELRAYVTPQGLQIGSLGADGKGTIYSIAQDANGNMAGYKATGQYANGNPIFGSQVAAGDYGFNQTNNTMWKTSASIPNITASPTPTMGITQAHDNILTMLNNQALQSVNNMQLKLQNPAMPAATMPTLQLPQASSSPNNKGVYWKGSDNNVWVKGSAGTNSAGAFNANTTNYWNAQGYNQISDPNPGNSAGTSNPLQPSSSSALGILNGGLK